VNEYWKKKKHSYNFLKKNLKKVYNSSRIKVFEKERYYG